MSELLLKTVNMSVAASWLILAVLGLRFLLKKAPKRVNVLLWGIVAVRLVCPFSIESTFSLIPSAEIIPEAVMSGANFEIQTGLDHVDESINNYLGDLNLDGVIVPSINTTNAVTVLSVVWLVGIFLLIAYAVISYWRFHRKVDTAVLLRNNIYQCETVVSPCVLGVILPKIYLPFKMDSKKLEYVIAHEQAHIRRGDHWWKPLGFLLLTIHWFNPLVWIAYMLLCRDIEFACDEKVIKELNNQDRADYTQALVECSMSRRSLNACPLAFGEVGVKERVKSIMKYRRPALWVNILAVTICAVVALCFLTNPVKAIEDLTPDDSYVETRPEETTKPDVDFNDEKPGERDDAEILAAAEAAREELEREIARLQAEYEKIIKAERENKE